MTSNYEKESAGLFGVAVRTDTTPLTGNFAVIQVITNTTFTTLTETNRLADSAVMTGLVIPAGTVMRGRFTAATIDADGFIRAHVAAPMHS